MATSMHKALPGPLPAVVHGPLYDSLVRQLINCWSFGDKKMWQEGLSAKHVEPLGDLSESMHDAFQLRYV